MASPRSPSGASQTVLPVAWDAERETRGAAPDRGVFRCPERGCPFASASLRAMVAHASAHRDEDAAPERNPARIAAGADRIRAALGLAPGQRPPDPPDDPGGRWPVTVTAGLAAATATAHAVAPATAVTVTAGLAAATAAALLAGEPCACCCGRAIPQWPPRPGRRFATDACRKRQQRRGERAELRELRAALLDVDSVFDLAMLICENMSCSGGAAGV